MFFYFCVCPSWFPPGIPVRCNFSSQSVKRKEYAIEVLVLTLCFKLCLEFDNLSLFAQSMGCPKRLIKTEPDQLSLKELLHLKTLMHAYVYACIFCYLMTGAKLSQAVVKCRDGSKGRNQSRKNGNTTTVCGVMSFPAFRYLGTDVSRG